MLIAEVFQHLDDALKLKVIEICPTSVKHQVEEFVKLSERKRRGAVPGIAMLNCMLGNLGITTSTKPCYKLDKLVMNLPMGEYDVVQQYAS